MQDKRGLDLQNQYYMLQHYNYNEILHVYSTMKLHVLQ